MHHYGYSATGDGSALCALRVNEDQDFAIGIMGIGYTTPAEHSSPGLEAAPIAAATMIHDAKEKLNILFEGENKKDSRLIASSIRTALRDTDIKLRAYSKALAQGVYAGGCICVCHQGHNIICAFGGVSVYKLKGDKLQKIIGGSKDGIIYTALGAEPFTPMIIQGETVYPDRLIITSHPITNPTTWENIIAAEEPFAPANATAILLCQELAALNQSNTAVMDLQY